MPTPWDYLRHVFPALRWLPSYNWRANLLGDVVAGLTVTAVAAPEAVSYAAIANLPPETGLYTGFLAPLAYGLLGASPQLIVGPTAIMCILTGNAIPSRWNGQSVPASATSELHTQLAATLALFVAVIQAAMGLLGLGSVVSLISLPVVAGFTTGSALLTASSQLSSLFGLKKCTGGSDNGGCTFADSIAWVVDYRSSIPWQAPLLSLACIAILVAVKFGPGWLGLKGRWKLASNLAPLVLVFIAVPVEYAYGDTFVKWGMEAPKPIPSSLPAPWWPFPPTRTPGADYGHLLAAAVPLAIIGYMGAVTITKTVARQSGRYRTDPAQEMWGQVAANTACAFGRGLPITGSFSRTAVNAAAGARTGLACVLGGLFMVVALRALAPQLEHIPSVARAAIVVVAIAKMVEVSLLPHYWRADKRDFVSFVATLLVVMFVDAAYGLAAGVAVQWLGALTRGVYSPSPLRLWNWTVESGVAAKRAPLAAAACGSVLQRLLAGGYTWGPAPADADLRRQGAGTSAAEIALPEVGLQFAGADRLQALVAEATALLAPAAIVLSVGAELPAGVVDAPGASTPPPAASQGIDSTGATALLSAGADAAAEGSLVIVAGLSRAARRTLLVCAAAEAEAEWAAAAVLESDGAGQLASELRALGCSAVGSVLAVPSRDAALAAAQLVAAASLLGNPLPLPSQGAKSRRAGLASGSPYGGFELELSGSGSATATAPLLSLQEVAAGSSGSPDDEGAGESSTSASRLVGVPPSPLQAARERARRARGVQPAGVGRSFDEGDGGKDDEGDGSAQPVGLLRWLVGCFSPSNLRQGWRTALWAATGSASDEPLLVAADMTNAD